jgi:hypothetical protein
MPRLRKRHLPFRITLTPYLGSGEEGDLWGTAIPDVPAMVAQKTHLKVDRRSTSKTYGQQIVSTTAVVVLPEHDVPPGTRVTVFPGKARERTSVVIDSALGEYDTRTPNHVELYLE